MVNMQNESCASHRPAGRASSAPHEISPSGAAEPPDWPGLVLVLLFLAGLLYLYRKIFVPFNYVQDLDLPGTSKRRDLVNLRRKLRRAGAKLPPPFPNGWYAVAESSQLQPGRVLHADCFGESLAVFRGEDSHGGKPHVVEARCPHLGANLAVGGAVRGDCLECPFHKWTFSGDSGKCVAIPGVDNIPAAAAVRSWECREVDGCVFVWHNAAGGFPSWELPFFPPVNEGRWTCRARNEFLIPCHIQEIPENGADLAHLNAIHSDNLMSGTTLPTSDVWNILGRHAWSGTWAASETLAHEAALTMKHSTNLFDKFALLEIDVFAKQIGPGYVQMHLKNKKFSAVILQTVTPLAPLLQQVVHRLYVSWELIPVANLLMWAETVMFHRDVMVWASKEHLSNPMLVKTDRCLKAYRNWFKQFYSEESITFDDAMKGIGNSIDW